MKTGNGHSVKLIYLLFAAFLAMLLGGCAEKPPPAPPPPEVDVVILSETTVPIYKTYIGITQSVASVDIRARVKGFLIKMNFVEGKPVKKGQLLFIIDPKPFQAELDLAQGQLSQSIANREYQQVQYQRLKNLVAGGNVSKSDFDQISAKYAEAQAQVQVATANVEQAKINLGYTSMYSPIDGLISKKYVDVGNLVGGTENTVLANVVTLNPLYVEFNPSVEDFSEFLTYRENMPFPVEVTLPQNKDIVLKGKIDLINNQAAIPTSTILMRAVIENKDNLLLPGIYVNLRLSLNNKNKGLLVPMKAVIETQNQRTVYIVDKENRLESRIITISGQYGQQYLIKTGLKAGDKVIVSGLQKLKSGEAVNPRIIQ